MASAALSPESIRIGGRAVGHVGPAERRALGLAYVPEERLGRGAVPEMSLTENSLLTARRRGMVRHGLVDWQAVRAVRRTLHA